VRLVVAEWWFVKVSPLLYGEIYDGDIFFRQDVKILLRR
jgi:hypothetical protein